MKAQKSSLLAIVPSFLNFALRHRADASLCGFLRSARLRRREGAEQLGSLASTPDYFASRADPGVWREEC